MGAYEHGLHLLGNVSDLVSVLPWRPTLTAERMKKLMTQYIPLPPGPFVGWPMWVKTPCTLSSWRLVISAMRCPELVAKLLRGPEDLIEAPLCPAPQLALGSHATVIRWMFPFVLRELGREYDLEFLVSEIYIHEPPQPTEKAHRDSARWSWEQVLRESEDDSTSLNLIGSRFSTLLSLPAGEKMQSVMKVYVATDWQFELVQQIIGPGSRSSAAQTCFLARLEAAIEKRRVSYQEVLKARTAQLEYLNATLDRTKLIRQSISVGLGVLVSAAVAGGLFLLSGRKNFK